MISDNYKLLGLIINTIPFAYTDNTVTANYSGYVEISELTALKSQLETNLSKLPDTATDQERINITDDILFVTNMIENLTRASN